MLAQHPREIFTLGQLHHHEMVGAFFAVVEDAGDVGMRKRGRGARFALEAFDERRIVGEPAVEDLDGYATAEAVVDGSMDRSHPTGDDLPHDPVAIVQAAGVLNHPRTYQIRPASRSRALPSARARAGSSVVATIAPVVVGIVVIIVIVCVVVVASGHRRCGRGRGGTLRRRLLRVARLPAPALLALLL